MIIKISKNKQIILETSWTKEDWQWFGATIAFTRKIDHAGFDFFMELGRFYFRFSINDKRFWDRDEDKWYEPAKHEQTTFK